MIDLPEQSPGLAIIHPQKMSVAALWGAATNSADVTTPQWHLDGKKVANGLDAWAQMPKAGMHVAELRAKNAETMQVTFTVRKAQSQTSQTGFLTGCIT